MARFITKHKWVLGACALVLAVMVGCSSPPEVSNPLEPALASGKPTIAEFGRGTCIPCKEMKPILQELASEYVGKLNVLIIDIDDYRALTNRYGIMVIPTQIVFDSSGNKIMNHIGLWPKEEIVAQLKDMGIN